MSNKHISLVFFFIMLSMMFYISGCDKSVDPQNKELDLSKITATGAQGPQDFIGNIDISDWDPSSYSSVIFAKSFWIQKYSSSDTLYFGGFLTGDIISQSLKIYNWDNASISIKLNSNNPHFSMPDSVEIQPSNLGYINISFILPDTTNTVYNDIITLKYSAQDSIVLKIKGYRVSYGSGPVVVSLPTSFSLEPAFPNPADGHMIFSFTVPQTIGAVLKVVNKKNEEVAIIAQGSYAAGIHTVSWNANLANDNYRVIFEAGNYTSQGDVQISR